MDRGRRTDDADYMDGQDAAKGKAAKSGNGETPMLDQTVYLYFPYYYLSINYFLRLIFRSSQFQVPSQTIGKKNKFKDAILLLVAYGC